MDNAWAIELGPTIYSIVKAKATEQLKDKYPTLNVTDKGESDQPAVFPTVYIHELPGMELGQDLEGQTINAVRETIQVDVTSNKNHSECKKIMSKITDIYKQMRFSVTGTPQYDVNGGTYICNMRFSRVFGAGDTIL